MPTHLYSSPSFIFMEGQAKEKRLSTEFVQAAKLHLAELLSTEQGSVLCLPEYGLPPTAELNDEADTERMSQEIVQTIRKYLPHLEPVLGALSVEFSTVSEDGKEEHVFAIKFEGKQQKEQKYVETRYVDARWIVKSAGDRFGG